jgi:predicted enzyme related to lactoylglutathione lyase
MRNRDLIVVPVKGQARARDAMSRGAISHIEFPADDIERAKRFYGAIAGWEFGEMAGIPGFWLFRSGAESGGGVGKRGVTVGNVVRVYIDVDDLDTAVAAAGPTVGQS